MSLLRPIYQAALRAPDVVAVEVPASALTLSYMGPNTGLWVDADRGSDVATAAVDLSPIASTVSTQGTDPTFTSTQGPGGGKALVFTGSGNLKYSPGYPNDGPLLCLFRAKADHLGGASVIAATSTNNLMETDANKLGTFGNSGYISSSVDALNGEDHLFMIDASVGYGTGRFRDNGTDVGAYASSGTYGETLLGGTSGQRPVANIRLAICGTTPWNVPLLDDAAIFQYHIYEAVVLWEAGLESLLPGGHPFKTERPLATLVEDRVLIGGDSYAVDASTSYSALFEASYSGETIQRAVAGTTSEDWKLIRFDQTVAARPKALALQLGTNLYAANLGNLRVAADAAAALIALWNYYQDALPGMDLFFPTILPVGETAANTSLPAGNYTGFNTWRAAVNTIIRAQHNTTRNGGRRICYDFAADATIGVDSAGIPANGFWDADGVHPLYATQQTYMYPIFNATMAAAGYS